VIRPIKPSEITKAKAAAIPDWVIEAVNELLLAKWNGREARFTLKEVMALAMPKAPEATTRQQVYDNHLMDFEDLYRKEGWKVLFDKAGYNESYDDFFVFTR
jgi:hypothetical protein